MFDLDQFIVDRRNALVADKSHELVREVVARAMIDPTAVLQALGERTPAPEDDTGILRATRPSTPRR